MKCPLQNWLIASGFIGFLFLMVSCSSSSQKQEPTLNVLVHDPFISYESEEFNQAIQLFEEKENIKINWISYGSVSPALLKKIQDPSFPVDLIYGIDNTMLGDFKDTQAFLPYQSEEISNIQEDLLLDKDYFFTPINYGWIAFEYSEKDFKGIIPKEIEDLLKEEGKNTYIISQPRTSDIGLLLALWLEAQGKNVSEILPALKKNSFALPPDWNSAWLLYSAKEAPLILTYGTSPAYNIFVENDYNHKTALDKENSYLQVEFMGISRHTKKEEKAKKFLDYMISETIQKTLPRKVWVLPSRKNIELPPEFATLEKPKKFLSHTPEEIKKLKEEWINSHWF